ncbi:MAG: hypothetical protein KKD44_21060 [Proteobacteria bacterium]|nr:hypothetical protein [Pseudomonadota bacterium]
MDLSTNRLKNRSGKLFTIIVAFMLVLPMLFTGCDSDETEVYTALTQDDVEVKLYRYRPADDAPFRTDCQPVLLMGGMGMNINEFLPHTTDKMKDVYAKMELPTPLPDWAVGDEYIQKDHLLLYNLGYYLWQKGYDPWFGNLRGIGREPVKSEAGIKQTNIDVFACLDVPAMVDKISEVTGMKPMVGGHSTGATATYMYLTGAYMDIDEVMAGKNADPTYLPHVKISDDLAKARNRAINGFIAIDPASIPPLPEYLDFDLLWTIANAPMVLPLDSLMQMMLVDCPSTRMVMSSFMATMFDAISDYAMDHEAIEWLHFFETDNIDPYVFDHYMRYAVGNMSLRIVSQYADWGLNMVVREHYTNGVANKDLVKAPPRAAGDGYTYYEDHMDNITTPTICALSDYNGLVAAQTVLDYVMGLKTPHAMDHHFIMPDTAHADLPCGRTAATVLFPAIGDWIDQMQ